MRSLMWILMWATVLPMVALGAWMLPALATRWRREKTSIRLGLIGLWLLGSAFLLLFPHDDSFTGLDNMTYRQLSHAFLQGRGFHDPDTVLAEVPEALRESFLLHRGPSGRPTRDRAFQLSDWKATETTPFFMPVLSLAAAGLEPALAPERFVPLAGALWWALILAAGFCAGGGRGLAVAAALALGTAWPAWFFRGFHAEAVGAALIAGVVAASAVRPVRGFMAGAAGFALGLAASYHPTLVVLSGPVAIGLLLERNDPKSAVALVAGGLAGFFPFWAFTRWVCRPYGDWTRWETLKTMVFSVPEHRAVALALGVLAVVFLAALGAGFRPSVRTRIRRLDALAAPWGWLAVCAAPFLLIAVAPGEVGESLRKGAASVWSGIGWPVGLLVLAGAGLALRKDRPLRERWGLATLCWGALLFLFIQGVEIPVGLWSHRRFLPVALLGIVWLVSPLSAGLAARGRLAGWMGAALVLFAGLGNVVRWPAAYFTVNERGATEWTRAVSERIGPDRRVVFDYYAHSVPYAAGLDRRVLGLGESSWNRWPEVAGWLAEQSRREEVWTATSWSPCTLEEGTRLEPVFAVAGRFPFVRTKHFFPAERGEREVNNTFLRWVPLAEGETAAQNKALDGSPIGLRGPWGPVRRGATWTRQGAGIVGPVPEKGRRVVFEAECGWAPPSEEWTEQTLLVAPPWGGEPLRLVVPAGESVAKGNWVRPAEDAERPGTGVYSLSVERPWDPALQGLRGYPPDLGVQVRRIIIRVEPGVPSVPN